MSNYIILINFVFQTIDSFHGAILILTGSINIVIAAIFCIIFIKRSDFKLINRMEHENKTNIHTKENLEVTGQD